MIAGGQSDEESGEEEEDLKLSAKLQAGSFMAKSDGEVQPQEPES